MPRLPTPQTSAAAFARSAQQELSQLRSAMRSLQDGVAGLGRAIKAPNVQPRRTTIRSSTSGISPWLSLGARFLGDAAGGGLANFIDPDLGGIGSGSFYQSTSQQGARMVAMTIMGQRVR